MMIKRSFGSMMKRLGGVCAALAKIHLLKKSMPFSALFVVTNRCNQKCVYCGFERRSKKEMTTRQICGLIDQLVAMGTQRIGITGGEPLLRDDIGDIINYAKKRNCFVSLDTNGTLVAKKIKDIEAVDLIVASLDGPHAVQDRHRFKGSFGHQMEAIRIAKEHGITVWGYSVVSKHNLSHEAIENTIRLAEQLRIKIFFTPLLNNPLSTTANVEQMIGSDADYRLVFQRIREAKNQNRSVLCSRSYIKHVLRWPDYGYSCDPEGTLLKERFLPCFAGRAYCDIDADGTVYPCLSLIGHRAAQNALEVGMEKAFLFSGSLTAQCHGCIVAALTELNLLFSMDIDAIANQLFDTGLLRRYFGKR